MKGIEDIKNEGKENVLMWRGRKKGRGMKIG
jgi:hypothetical protein